MSIKVRYYATGNRISPFVALVGPWPSRAAMAKSTITGVFLGARPALESEIELFESSCRCVALTWGSLCSFLWTHRGPDLERWYEGLFDNIKRNRREIKRLSGVVEKKKEKHMQKKAAENAIKAANRARRRAAADPQLPLFGIDGTY